MKSDWASEQLQTIRTLMERSALYRRALAPVTTLAGVIGVAAGIGGWALQFAQPKGFVIFWLTVALVTFVCALLLIRRQAFKEAEPLWSLPTRRVAQAMALPLVAGALVSVMFLITQENGDSSLPIIAIWLLFYGFALNAAGFFMQRGIRLFGWLMAICGLMLGFVMIFKDDVPLANAAEINLLMGGLFGLPHLAYGIYLYFTEKSGAS